MSVFLCVRVCVSMVVCMYVGVCERERVWLCVCVWDAESGSEASDSVSNSGQTGSQNANNVTVITLNSEGTIQHSLVLFVLFSYI